MITKKSSYSPCQYVDPSPGKAYDSRKLKVYSYNSEGRSSAFKEAPKNVRTADNVVLKDTRNEAAHCPEECKRRPFHRRNPARLLLGVASHNPQWHRLLPHPIKHARRYRHQTG